MPNTLTELHAMIGTYIQEHPGSGNKRVMTDDQEEIFTGLLDDKYELEPLELGRSNTEDIVVLETTDYADWLDDQK